MKRFWLPPEFDPRFYRKCKPYLADFPDLVLEREFREFGTKSGTPGSFLCYRENVRNFLMKAASSILEIGPGGHPDFAGPNVRYLDVFTTDEMRERYSGEGSPPAIDFSLEQLASGTIPMKFDAVYSAHNFEHQVNPVMHIESVSKVLVPEGLFVAVVPDRNFTFDYFRPASTLADVLSSPASQTEHSLRSRLGRFNRTHNDCFAHWFGDHGENQEKADDILKAYEARDDTAFMSLHVEVYDPESFRLVFGTLSRRGLLVMELLRVYNTPFPRNEFVAVFRKSTSDSTNDPGEHNEK